MILDTWPSRVRWHARLTRLRAKVMLLWVAQVRWRTSRLHWKLIALRNWLEGYAFSPVRRCRECDHTTPFHYARCSLWRPGERLGQA